MKRIGMCEANCGASIIVHGNKYCPECHKKYSSARFGVQFCPASEHPRIIHQHSEFLLLNKCDGYHIAEAHFLDNGEFDAFYSFGMEQEYTPDFYLAWAVLPDAVERLHPAFVTG